MIEIEKKYSIDREKIRELIQKAKFISKQELVDIYYDSDDFKLTTKDWWLRNRNGKFELKMVNLGKKNSAVDRYKEINDEREICQFLEIQYKIPLIETLGENDIKPFATIKSTREKYKNGEFTLDFDITDFGYSICEIELMVDSETGAEAAVEKIEDFAQNNGLNSSRVRGKLVEYIYRNSPQHYRMLVEAGVVVE